MEERFNSYSKRLNTSRSDDPLTLLNELIEAIYIVKQGSIFPPFSHFPPSFNYHLKILNKKQKNFKNSITIITLLQK